MKDYSFEQHTENLAFLSSIIESEWENIDYSILISRTKEIKKFLCLNTQYSFLSSYHKLRAYIEKVYTSHSMIFLCSNGSYNNKVDFLCVLTRLLASIQESYKVEVYMTEGSDNSKWAKISKVPIIQKKEFFIEKSNEPRTFNLLLVDRKSFFEIESDKIFDLVIDYETLIQELYWKSCELHKSNYDFHYLKNAISRASEKDTDCVILGSSYSLYAVESQELNKTSINLSLPSQDFYYSSLILRKIIDRNPNISHIYLGTGYWSFHYDLSKASRSGTKRIERVYYPILNQSNHYKITSPMKIPNFSTVVSSWIKYLFDVDILHEEFGCTFFKSVGETYFFENQPREQWSELAPRTLYDIEAIDRGKFGFERASLHNKLLLHHETYEHSELILGEIMKYLNDKKKTLTILNFPGTQYYQNELNKDFSEKYYQSINRLKQKYNFEFIDFASEMHEMTFTEEDFVDFDHMSLLGARKITAWLNNHLALTDSKMKCNTSN